MSPQKGADEIYCKSCGEVIKKKAEMCPECGVPNNYNQQQQTAGAGRTQRPANRGIQNLLGTEITETIQEITSSDNQPQRTQQQHNPSTHSTTVSSKWQYGIVVSLLLWVVGIVMPNIQPVAGLVLLTAWAAMPISMYFDRQYVRATMQWNPPTFVWVLLSVVPLVNLAAGVIYLLRRRSEPRISPPNTGISRTSQTQNDSALEELRERYSRGELSDAEFEEKVEKVVATKNEETAEMHVRTQEESSEK